MEGMNEIASMGEAGRIEKGRVVHAQGGTDGLCVLVALSVFAYAVWMGQFDSVLLQALAKVRTETDDLPTQGDTNGY